MPDTIAAKNFEKTVKNVLTNWAGKIKKPLQDIQKINDELEKLAAQKKLTPADEKRRDLCLKARKNLIKKVERAADGLRVNLLIITPPPDLPKSEFDKLVKRIKGIVKTIEKGLPIVGGLRLKPDIDFDFKKLKFKKFGLILEWRF